MIAGKKRTQFGIEGVNAGGQQNNGYNVWIRSSQKKITERAIMVKRWVQGVVLSRSWAENIVCSYLYYP